MGDTVAQIAFRLNGKHLGRFAVAAVFLLCFFASVTWGACTTYTSYIGVNAGKSCTVNSSFRPSCPSTYVLSGYTLTECTTWNGGDIHPEYGYCSYGSMGCWVQAYDYDCCSNQCEADSLLCVNQGYTWVDDPSASCGKSCSSCDEQCQCEEQPGMIWNGTECVEDSSLCAEDRANCVRAGGIFSGSTNSGIVTQITRRNATTTIRRP